MGKETFKANFFQRKDKSSQHPSLLLLYLPILVEKMKKDQCWMKGELSTMVLLKTPDKRIVLTALHDGTEIESFQSNESITFQIIEGRIIFHTHNESINLAKGQLLTVHENIKYGLTASEETILLFTISTGGLQLSRN